MDASLSAENSRCLLSKVTWLSANIVWGSSPMFVIVIETRQNWPWALVLKYWSPTFEMPHFIPVTTNSNLPSRTLVPNFGVLSTTGAAFVGAGAGAGFAFVAVGVGVAETAASSAVGVGALLADTSPAAWLGSGVL